MSAASILVVDDEPQIRRVLRSTLSFRGYEISEAKSGEEALELARKLKPDLILLDVNLPGISGIETCKEIRRGSSSGAERIRCAEGIDCQSGQASFAPKAAAIGVGAGVR